jgi:preprotein translocase subunit SecB
MAKSDPKNGKDETASNAMAGPSDKDVTTGESSQEAPVQRLSVRTQYIKDFSFENPAAPKSLAPSAVTPKIQVNVDVEAKPLSEDHYEVALRVTANASREEGTVFVVELVYAGVFALENFPKEHLQSMCLVECPRILFPFARRVIADATREGGFPPLYLDPIDFGRLYQKNLEDPGAVNPTPPVSPEKP